MQDIAGKKKRNKRKSKNKIKGVETIENFINE
jgi:hypothetical protein